MEPLIVLCEGTEHSFDYILLNKLFTRLERIRVIPVGSRFGMKLRIDAIRKVYHHKVYGILDRDFPEKWEKSGDVSIDWFVSENEKSVRYGWFWARKELENYLLDKMVIMNTSVGKSFPFDHYQKVLEQSRNSLVFYQAARIAMSILGRTGQYYVPSAFGVTRGTKEKYCFPKEDQLTENECLRQIDSIYEEYLLRHSGRFETLRKTFQQYVLECCEGGCRFEDYLSAFSGKDLAWKMDDWFVHNGFQGTRQFLHCIVHEIFETKEDIALWLPEWKNLYELLEQM